MSIETEIYEFSLREMRQIDNLIMNKFSAESLKSPEISLPEMINRCNDISNASNLNLRHMLICMIGLSYIFFNKNFEISWGPVKLSGLGSVLDVLLIYSSLILSSRAVIHYNGRYYSALIRRMIEVRLDPELWRVKIDETFTGTPFAFSDFQRAFFFKSDGIRRLQYLDSPVLFLLAIFFVVYFVTVVSGTYTVATDESRDTFSKLIVCAAVIYSHSYFLIGSTRDAGTKEVKVFDKVLSEDLHSYLKNNGEEKTRDRIDLLRRSISPKS